MKIRRAIEIEFEPQELLQFFSVPDGLWRVKGKGLPLDYRVVDMTFRPERQTVRVVVETEDPDWFYACARGQEPPFVGIYSEVQCLGSFDYHPRPQCVAYFKEPSG